MATRFDGLIDDLRRASRPERAVPEVARTYAEKVRRDATTVDDGDVETLIAAGLSEDEVFELTVAGAVNAGLDRLTAALGTLS